MTHVKDQDNLMDRLTGVWRRGRRFASLRGGCRLVLCAIALLAVVFVLDWQMDLAGEARLVLLGICVLILAGAGYLAWWRDLRPHDPVACALQVERDFPEFGGLLVSYVQFHDKGIVHEGASPTLVAAMLQQAEEQARKVPLGNVVRFGSIWKLYLLVIIVCTVVAAAAAWQPGFARAFVFRMLDPFAETRYPTRTVLEETSGDLVIRQGESVRLRAVVSGEIPDEVALRFIQPGGAEDVIGIGRGEAADGGGSAVFEHEIKEVHRDFEYAFLAGDAVSRTSRVRVVRPPDQEIRAEVVFPAYLERAPEMAQMPDFEAPAGSRIQWRITADRPVARGRMILDGDQAVPISLADDRLSGTVALTPEESFTYGIEWTDVETGLVFSPGVRHPVRMVPDQAPVIVMESSATGEKATIWKVADLAFTARDDHGLASARLVYKVSRAEGEPGDGGELSEEILVFPKACTETTENLKWRVGDSIPDLAPGDVISYAVEVLDRKPAPDGPGMGRSGQYQITIVSQEEYVRIAMEKRRRLLARIKSLHDEEIEADKAVRSLLKETPEETDQTPESR
jgi:hypothetical protein